MNQTKSEIRMSKSETRSKSQIPMTRTSAVFFGILVFRNWDLFRISYFEFQ